jgi:hypothetical protein
MYGYERSYKAGRAVCTWIEFVGWSIVALGVILAFVGLASGGIMGSLSRNLGQGDTLPILRIFSMMPGILMAAGGLISIMLAQQTKATIDTAEMTRELLVIARTGRPDASHGNSIRTPVTEKRNSTLTPVAKFTRAPVTKDIRESVTEVSGFKEGFIGSYLTVTIIKSKGMYLAYGKEFKTLDEAKDFIETLNI